MLGKRQRAYALSCSRENRVAYRRQNRRERGLAEAGRRIIRLQEVHFDFGRHQ